jgi:transcriptional regulator GlxA family with amidase domain
MQMITLAAVAMETGFIDPERMRRAFLRIVGHPPQTIRRFAKEHAARDRP